ncbi:MAG: crossover junction endodeoxyribonuclease RuvC [Candidatus Nanopelagicales bacterium]
MSRIILGVDPGLTRCGFGLVRASGSKVEYVHAGVIRTSTDLPVDERLHGVWLSLLDLINEYLPAAMAVERVYAQVNLRTVMGTAQVSGLALTLARLNGLPVSTYTPTEMKAAVTGSGRADKAQVTTMVQRLLKLSAPVKPADASDALGLAICHAWRGSAQERIATALAAARP